jgi:hypothetical protein
MWILTEQLKDLTTRRGLYRIWVPAAEGQSPPLIARWIDSEVKGDEHEEQTSFGEKEERTRCSGTNLQAA